MGASAHLPQPLNDAKLRKPSQHQGIAAATFA
jgi:hypothetical protein